MRSPTPQEIVLDDMRPDPFKFTSSLDISNVRVPPDWVPYPEEEPWQPLRNFQRAISRLMGTEKRSHRGAWAPPRRVVDVPMPDVKPPHSLRPDVRPKPQPARHK